MEDAFWHSLNMLITMSECIVDRPRGSQHPRYRDVSYPLDYGYLQGTRGGDGDGVDVWIGSRQERCVTAVIVTVDLENRDSEIKVLLGCTSDEARMLLEFHRKGSQSAILCERQV
jgi:inorganic pyrophosphatase